MSNLPTMIAIPKRPYSVSQTPVTVRQYTYFCKATNRNLPTQPEPKHPDNPVVNVLWSEATSYCNWLSDSKLFRLPTKAEYEHFCGDHQEGTPETAVYGQEHICPVATKQPNKFGLHDVLGLVWEWQQKIEGNFYIVRGGSWFSGQVFARAVIRHDFHPSARFESFGFRVVCSSPSLSTQKDTYTPQ